MLSGPVNADVRRKLNLERHEMIHEPKEERHHHKKIIIVPCIVKDAELARIFLLCRNSLGGPVECRGHCGGESVDAGTRWCRRPEAKHGPDRCIHHRSTSGSLCGNRDRHSLPRRPAASGGINGRDVFVQFPVSVLRPWVVKDNRELSNAR